MAQIKMEEGSHNDQLYEGEQQSMHHRVPTTAYQVCETRDRCHERVLNCAFPPLHVDDVGHSVKGYAQV